MIKIKGKDQRPIARGHARPAAKKKPTRRKPPAEPGDGRAPVLVRIPFDLLARLDAEHGRRENRGDGGSRNDLILTLLSEGLPQPG